MELVDLGASGLRVSRVGLGCNNFGSRIELAETRKVVEAALEVGVTFFDTAEVYGGGGGSERMLGEILEGRRDEVRDVPHDEELARLGRSDEARDEPTVRAPDEQSRRSLSTRKLGKAIHVVGADHLVTPDAFEERLHGPRYFTTRAAPRSLVCCTVLQTSRCTT